MIASYAIDFSSIPVASYVFFGLFIIASIAELVFAYLEKEKIRMIVKPFCLLLLSIAALCYMPSAWLIYVGALMGCVGDVFLIWKKNKKCFAIGMLAFFLGHVCYIAQIIWIMEGVLNWAYYLAGAFLVIAFNLGAYQICKKVVGDGRLAFASDIYLSFLGMVPVAAFVGCFLGFFSYMFIVFLGGLSFIASDSILAYTIFKKDIKRRDFFIMAFYLLAQALIVLGLLFTLIAH